MREAVERYAREIYHNLLVESENNAMLKGKIEGKREGIIEGRLEGKIEVINNMLHEGISLETALKITGVDEETYRKHADKKRVQ